MTFVGHIVYLWPVQHHLRLSGARVQMMLRGTQINYMPDKSHAIIIIINTQGQIVQIHLIRKKCLTEMTSMKLWYGKLLLQYDQLNKSQIKFLFV